MILNPSILDNNAVGAFKPSQAVFVPKLTLGEEDDYLEIYSTMAYDTEEEARSHWWLTRREYEEDETVEITIMTAGDFVKKRVEDGGMNPFETLNILEFAARFLGDDK